MPTASYVAVAGSREVLVEGINAGSDQWAIGLSASAPANTTFVSGTTDLATSGGYTAGGNNVSTTTSAETTGVYKLVIADPTAWTASGGGFTFQYALLINKTNNLVIGYWNYGSSQAVAAGETVTVDLDGTNGVFQVA